MHSQSLETAASKPTRRRRVNHRGRSKTGCQTCRIRHVKCDETTPTCMQCSSTGRTCDGYAAHLTPSKPSGTTVAIVRHENASYPGRRVTFLIPSPFPDADHTQRRFFSLFQRDLARKVSGPFTQGLWLQKLPRLSAHEPAVFAVVAAIAAVICGRWPAHGERLRGAFLAAKTHDEAHLRVVCGLSAKAVRGMRNLLAEPKPSLDATALCCILLVTLETLRSDYTAAMVHLDCYLRYLVDVIGLGVVGATMDPDLLMYLFVLDYEVTQFECPRRPVLGLDNKCELVKQRKMENMRVNLMCNAQRLAWQPTSPLDVLDDPKKLDFLTSEAGVVSQEMADFHFQCGAILRSNLRPTASTLLRHESSLLIIQHALLTIKAGVRPAYSQLVFDAFDKEFATIVELSAAMRDDSAMAALQGFTTDSGVIEALFQTAVRCREPNLRRRANLLLSAGSSDYSFTAPDCPVYQEGVWVSNVAAAVSQVVIDVEEGDGEWRKCPGGEKLRVPAHRRVFKLIKQLDPKMHRAEVLCLLRPDGPYGRVERVERVAVW